MFSVSLVFFAPPKGALFQTEWTEALSTGKQIKKENAKFSKKKHRFLTYLYPVGVPLPHKPSGHISILMRV
jgi:hypothetical protein